jgi:putative MATE family efflux protein
MKWVIIMENSSDSLDSTASPMRVFFASLGKIGKTLGEAIHGSHRDYTQGPIGTSILFLAIPMVLEMIMESVFAVVDVFFVAKLGAHAIATVGLTESMLSLVYTMAVGFSIGAAAMVARRIGEKDADGAAIAAVQAITLGMTLSIFMGILGATLAPYLLNWMGADPQVIEHGTLYTRVMLGGNSVIMLLFLVNAIFRGAGDGAIAMRALWLANGINIVLGPVLIFGLGPFPKLGVTGAAIATTIGRGTGALYALTRLLQKGGHIQVKRDHLRIQPQVMSKLMRLSGAGVFQTFTSMASWIGLIRILSEFGSAALAGYTIGIRVVLFALFPSFGLSNAAATMVGQALGAKNPERAEKAVWLTGFYNMCFLGGVSVIFILFAPAIIRLFSTEPAIVSYGVDCLRVVACGFIFYAYGMVLTQSFNGAGDTWTPTWINLFIFWIFEMPMAYLLAKPFGMGPHGVFLAITLAFSSLAVVSAILFRKGKWKTRQV